MRIVGVGVSKKDPNIQSLKREDTEATTRKELLAKLGKFNKALSFPWIGREEECLLITLGLVSKMNVLFVSEPGTTKSAMIKRAGELLGAKVFVKQLNKETRLDQLIGPLDVNAYVNDHVYQRNSNNMLQQSHIAFFDETFDAPGMLLNALRSLLNERTIDDDKNGTVISTPLRTVIGATNILPDPDDKGLQGVYDRFHIRHFVNPIDEEKWEALLKATHEYRHNERKKPEPILGVDDLEKVHNEFKNVDKSTIRDEYIRLLKLFKNKYGLTISDRRKGDAEDLMAAHALVNGRDKLIYGDLMMLKYIIPKDQKEADTVAGILEREVLTPERCRTMFESVRKNIKAADDLMSGTSKTKGNLKIRIDELNKTKEKLTRISEHADDQKISEEASKLIENVDKALKKAADVQERQRAKREAKAKEMAMRRNVKYLRRTG